MDASTATSRTATDTVTDTAAPRSTAIAERLLPLSGAAFAVMTMAGNLVIDKFPDESTTAAALQRYYAAHHTQVGRGGWLIAYGAVFLVLFGLVLWNRVRRSGGHPVLAASVLVTTAMAASEQVTSGSTYIDLGQVAHLPTTTPGALQAWHIGGSLGITDVASVGLLLAVAVAGLAYRAVPVWMALTGLLLVVMHATPLSFFATLLFLAWALVGGIALSLHPGEQEAAPR